MSAKLLICVAGCLIFHLILQGAGASTTTAQNIGIGLLIGLLAVTAGRR